MRRSLLLVVSFVGAATFATCVQAEGDGFWASIARDWHRNNCWPQPFVYQDRQAAVAPFGVMIDKGWEQQNLLGEQHFDPESKSLTQSGKLKVRWILTQAPAQYRTVYIEHGATPGITSLRVDTVQQAAAAMLPTGDLPQVVVSGIEDRGHSADYIDNVSRKFQTTVPDPRLPKAGTGGSTSGGGSQ